MKKNSSIVVKDNRLIEASYKLDLSEQRLVLLAIVRARENSENITPMTWLDVNAQDYASTYHIACNSAYEALQEAATTLFSRQMTLIGIDPKTGAEGVIQTRWVSSVHYLENSGTVRMQLAPLVVEYISNLETRFTSYKLKLISHLTSNYAIRLYELLSQYRTIGQREIALAELKSLLGATEKSYERIDNFKNKVIEVAIKQINKHTDLLVEYEQMKQGRSVVALSFKMTSQHNPELEPELMVPSKNLMSTTRPITLNTILSLSEQNLLKQAQQQYPTLTKAEVIQMANDKNTDIDLILIELCRQKK